MAHILVADDEAHIREVLDFALTRAGHRVSPVADGEAALARLEEGGIDLVVLDVLMPELDGLATCREVRRRWDLPILFLSSRGEEADRVLGLDLGGDDYVTKPFSPRELVSRIAAILRRGSPRSCERELLRAGRLQIDCAGAEVFVDGVRVELTRTERRILETLLDARGRVFTREQLIERAYDDNHHVAPRTVDTHVRRLRRKLRDFELDPIETVHGVGYKAP